MKNKLVSFISFFLIGFTFFSVSALADGESVKRSNGYSAQGDVLIPYDVVMRCNLGASGVLELTDECMYALACDLHQVFESVVKDRRDKGMEINIDEYAFDGDHEVDCMMAKYTKANIDYIIGRLIVGGNHENMSKKKAGYKTVQTLGVDGADMGDCSSLEKQCNDEKAKRKGCSTDPWSCTLYKKCEYESKQIQAVKDCKDDQGSTRCSIQAHNTLSADNTQILLDVLRTKSMMSRSEFTQNITSYVLPKINIDKDKCFSDIKDLVESGHSGGSK